MGRRGSTLGENRKAYSIFVEKPEGKRPLGRPRRSWENLKRVWTGFIWLRI
jgi:hypothetical protein